MSTLNGGPNIVFDGLVLYLDAGNTKSYISGSTTWNDISRLGNNGTLINGPTFSSSYGGSIVLDGVNDLVSLPFILDTSTNYTIEVMAKCNTMIADPSPQNRQTIWSFSSGSSQGFQLLDLEIWNDGVTSFNGDNVNSTAPLISVFYPIGANNIHTYTLSKSGSNQAWYIDRVFRANAIQTYSGTSQFFKLGSRGGGSTGTGQQWNGLIYSVKIYNRALSATEITQNFNSTRGRFQL
jgi:hypothetical protein